MSRRRTSYINHSLVRITALVQLIIGSVLLVISGLILFVLPSFVFWGCFLLGFYLFLPGVVITFGLINRHQAQHWAKVMLPLWRWMG